MKKIILIGVVFLAMALVASPVLGVADNRRGHDHIGQFNFVIEPENRAEVKHDMAMAAIRNMKMVIDNSEPGDNIGCLIIGISKEGLRMLQGERIAGKVLVEPHPAESKKSLDDNRTYDYEVWNQPII